jgi:CDP-diacylglycerol---glycerol-3-phosphate 3-phosphatidyltransferase
MSLKHSRLGSVYTRLLERALVPPIKRFNLGPNAITFAGFVVAIMVPAGFLVHILLGFALMLFSGVIDTIDGLASRSLGSATKFGAFWDSTLDRFSDSLFLLGFWTVLWKSGGPLVWGSLLFCLAGLLTLMVSYAKARIEALGGTCSAGLMGREARTIYLLVWALLLGFLPASRQGIVWWGLWAYLLLVGFTVMQRVILAWKTLGKQPLG